MNLLLLSLAGFATSFLTATIGLGGGVILILLMPGLVPLGAILPVHSAVQLVSNMARVGFALEHVTWGLLLPVSVGSIVGAFLGVQAIDRVSLDWLPAIAGLLILSVTWLPVDRVIPRGRLALFFLGFYQTGLGMLAGATGPLGAAVLSRINDQREWLVVNTGVYMTLNHAVRAMAYALLGFAFAEWWLTISSMAAATVAGAWVGTKLRQRIPQRNFQAVFRWVVTILALRMVWLTFMELGA